jgi:signal transduction histidine kinase
MGSVEFSRVDMNAMVRDTVLLLEHQMRSASVTVTTDLAEPLPAILGNRGKLQQVLVNLVLNAKDALQDKKDGHVRIRTESSHSRIRLIVEDDGVGMSQEILRKIYDPFFTTRSNPREGHRKGTGLGLSVTYGIIQEHSGTIEVSSNVGEGTTFRLEFPIADSASSTGPGRLNDKNEVGKVVHV